MRHALCSVILLNLLLSSLPLSAQIDWQEVYDKSKPRIPIINQAGAICSGVLIAEDLSLTAAHCVDRLLRTKLQYGSEELTALIVAIDKDKDLALLRHDKVQNLKPLKIRAKSEALKIGEPTASVGHPSLPIAFEKPSYDPDYVYLLSQGVISGITKDNMITDMSLSPGNSGGPFLDREAQIVGIVSRKRVDPAVGNIGIGANADSLNSFVEQNKNSFASVPWYKAKSGFRGGISFGSRSFNDDSQRFDTLDLAYQFASRIWVSTHLPFQNNFKLDSYSEFRAGLQIHIPLFNNSMLLLRPYYGLLNWSDLSADGYGLEIGHSLLPLSLRYIEYKSLLPSKNLTAFEMAISLTGF